MWDNNTLIRFIKDRSMTLYDYVLPQRPILEGNPLVDNNVTRDQIRLREKLDEIQGTSTDDQLTGQIAEAITIGSKVTPISKDHPYTKEEIGEFLKYCDALDEWREYHQFYKKRENFNPYGEIDNIPIMSCLFSAEKEEAILVMSYNDNYITELNTNEISNVVGNRYRNQANQYYRATFDDIDHILMDTNFDELRKRLINAGYTELVNKVSEELRHY